MPLAISQKGHSNCCSKRGSHPLIGWLKADLCDGRLDVACFMSRHAYCIVHWHSCIRESIHSFAAKRILQAGGSARCSVRQLLLHLEVDKLAYMPLCFGARKGLACSNTRPARCAHCSYAHTEATARSPDLTPPTPQRWSRGSY